MAWQETNYKVFLRDHCGLDEAHGSWAERVTVRFDDTCVSDHYDLERRPVISIRGRPVSRETALEIIRRTDYYLNTFDRYEVDDNEIADIFRKHGVAPRNYCIHDGYYLMNWFPRPEETCFGWCHPDGYIGLDYHTSDKNPWLEEMLDPWAWLIANVTRDLDLVVGVTNCDEQILACYTLAEQIVFAYRIRGNVIELLAGEEARTVYREYDDTYGDHRLLGPLRDPREKMTPAERREDCFWRFDHTDEKSWGIWRGDRPISFGALNWCDPGPILLRAARKFLEMEPDSKEYRELQRAFSDPGSVRFMLKTDIESLPGPYAMVDKNHMCYYGVPDYSFHDMPLTMEDIERFALKFKEEQTVDGVPPEDPWPEIDARMEKRRRERAEYLSRTKEPEGDGTAILNTLRS